MATIRKEMNLKVPLGKVWNALADFQHVHTRLAPGFVVDSKPDGDNARIIKFANGSMVKETLVTLDEERHRLVYVVVCIYIDAAHQLHELAGLRLAMTTHFVNVFADEMERHEGNLRVFQIRESYID